MSGIVTATSATLLASTMRGLSPGFFAMSIFSWGKSAKSGKTFSSPTPATLQGTGKNKLEHAVFNDFID
jgi:hypothetical protein